MPLHLKKPLVVFDIEATGLNITQDRLVEISALKLHPDGREERKHWRVNPEIPIPPKIAKIIGITDEDVKDLPVFKSFARQIADFFSGADFCGYNPYKLDLPLLMEELMRAGVEFDVQKRRIVDVQRIFHMMEQRNLAAAYQFYCNKNLEKCHSAEDDTQATYEVLIAQLDRYEHLGTEVEKICSMTGNPIGRFVDLAGRIVEGDDGRENFNFGKYKGVAVEEVFAKDPGYYSWMMNGDFPAYTKKKLTEIRLRMKR